MEHFPPSTNCLVANSRVIKAKTMTRETRANSIIGGIIVVLLLLAGGYYFTGTSENTAQAPAPPAASDTAQTPAPAPTPGTDPTSTGATKP
jgi:hypothetical protein